MLAKAGFPASAHRAQRPPAQGLNRLLGAGPDGFTAESTPASTCCRPTSPMNAAVVVVKLANVCHLSDNGHSTERPPPAAPAEARSSA